MQVVTATYGVPIPPPQVSPLTIVPQRFSPVVTGRDTVQATARITDSQLAGWTCDVLTGTLVVKTTSGSGPNASVTWNGQGRQGDGPYTLRLTATNQAGKRTTVLGTATVDTRPPAPFTIVYPPAEGETHVVSDTL